MIYGLKILRAQSIGVVSVNYGSTFGKSSFFCGFHRQKIRDRMSKLDMLRGDSEVCARARYVSDIAERDVGRMRRILRYCEDTNPEPVVLPKDFLALRHRRLHSVWVGASVCNI